MSKSKKLPSINKVTLELLYRRLGQRCTRSLMAGYTENICNYIELSTDPDPSCTSCQISSMNKKSRSKNPLKPKAPFKWVLRILFQQHHQEV